MLVLWVCSKCCSPLQNMHMASAAGRGGSAKQMYERHRPGSLYLQTPKHRDPGDQYTRRTRLDVRSWIHLEPNRAVHSPEVRDNDLSVTLAPSHCTRSRGIGQLTTHTAYSRNGPYCTRMDLRHRIPEESISLTPSPASYRLTAISV